MKSQSLRKTAVLVTLAALLAAGAPPADAAFPVIDIPNLIQAIKRLQELSAMYAQGAAQLQQIRLRYQLALQMARNIPNLPARYKAVLADPSDPGVEVDVQQVSIADLRRPPYRAEIDFEEVRYNQADHSVLARSRDTVHVVFVFRPNVPNDMVPVNPLGLTITYFHRDKAF